MYSSIFASDFFNSGKFWNICKMSKYFQAIYIQKLYDLFIKSEENDQLLMGFAAFLSQPRSFHHDIK